MTELEELEKLKQRLAQVEEERDRAVSTLTDCRLVKAGGQPPEGFGISMSAEIVPLLAEALGRAFQRDGGINYVSYELTSQKLGPMELLLRRRHGKTEAQVNHELKSQLETVQRQRDQLLKACLRADADLGAFSDSTDADLLDWPFDATCDVLQAAIADAQGKLP